MAQTEVLITTDAELLAEFVRSRDEAAFQQLVQRHGALVMGVCRQILRHQHDADDAFQATFIVLALRAKAVKNASSLASWLYRVAYRTAMRAAKLRQRRQTDSVCEEVSVNDDPLEKIHHQSLQKVLHEELSQLPESYRAPLVLCYLEQRTRQEAAALLESTEASVKARLARGKRMLRLRIARRGVALSVALSIAVSDMAEASEALPTELLASTFELCKLTLEQGYVPASECSPDIVSLVKEGTETMFYSTLIKSTAAAIVASLCLTSYVLHAGDGNGHSSGKPTIDLDNAYAQAAPGSVRVAQATPQTPQSILSAGGGSQAKSSPGRRQYLLDRAAAFQKLAKAQKLKEASSASERLENEAKADLYLAETRRLKTEADSMNARSQYSVRAVAAPTVNRTTSAFVDEESVQIVTRPDGSQQKRQFTVRRNKRSAGNPFNVTTGSASHSFGEADKFSKTSGLNENVIVNSVTVSRAPVECCRENNLAHLAKASASSQETRRDNLASHAVDGNLATRWCAKDGSSGEWLQVDLKKPVDVRAIRIHWEGPAAYRYRILGSRDGEGWKTLADGSKNREVGHLNEHEIESEATRFVRVKFLGSSNANWGSIRELEISEDELSSESVEAWKRLFPSQKPVRISVSTETESPYPDQHEEAGLDSLFE